MNGPPADPAPTRLLGTPGSLRRALLGFALGFGALLAAALMLAWAAVAT